MPGQQDDESHSLRGSIDRAALIAIHDLFNDEEPLATAVLDDFVNPNVLEVRYVDGLLSADHSRIDVQWTTRDDYKYHYTDSAGIDLRWSCHPHDGDYVHVLGYEHYHPPPDASSDPAGVEASCITLSPEALVTRAVMKLWRTAYHTENIAALNSGTNPP